MVFFKKFFNQFCPGTSRDRGFCPGTFAPALVPGQRDSGTGKTFLSRDKGTTGRPGLSRDVPSRGNTSLNVPIRNLILNDISKNQSTFIYHLIDYQWGMKMEGQNPFGHNGVHDVTTVKPKYLNPGLKPAPTRGPVVSQGKIISDEVSEANNNNIKDSNLPEWFLPNTLKEFNDPLLPPLMPGIK